MAELGVDGFLFLFVLSHVLTWIEFTVVGTNTSLEAPFDVFVHHAFVWILARLGWNVAGLLTRRDWLVSDFDLLRRFLVKPNTLFAVTQ